MGWEETTRKAPLPHLRLGEALTCTGFSPTTLLIIHVIHPLTMSTKKKKSSSGLCVGSPRPPLRRRSEAPACSLGCTFKPRIFLFYEERVATHL